jgi:mannose-6-phosphate isomerase-like protein (cupin superfamily)
MSGYSVNLEEKTIQNQNFREVLYTAPLTQLVVMSIAPGDDIGLETHDDHDQFIRVEKGIGQAIIGETTYDLADGIAIVIPAGQKHNVINTSSSEALQLYTVYAPAEHPEGKIHPTKEDALNDPDYADEH